jgi:hypothetical protein
VAPRLDPVTVAELARVLEARLRDLDARTAHCALCNDAEARAFLNRMRDWLRRSLELVGPGRGSEGT